MAKANGILPAAIVLAALTLGSAGPVLARDPGVNGRQFGEQTRIHEGGKSGQLTRPEARRLERQQTDIRRDERAYKADGHLSPGERAGLHQDLRDANRDIYRQKHDGQRR